MTNRRHFLMTTGASLLVASRLAPVASKTVRRLVMGRVLGWLLGWRG